MWNRFLLERKGRKEAMEMAKKKIKRKSIYLSGILIGLLLLMAACGSQNKSETTDEETDALAVVEQVTKEEENFTSLADHDKEETVYVKADAKGQPDTITVEALLKSGKEKQIQDYSVLKDIKNKEGDEEYARQKDGTLSWENKGSDIRYEGDSDKALPVQVSITYELDGKAITPQELAGKSGQLVMRFQYQNHETMTIQEDGKDYQVTVPFMTMSLCVLPEKVFSDVQIENGKILTFGDERVAIGYAFPGLQESLKPQELELLEELDIPDYVEISAQVKDFSMDFTATVIQNGMFEELDLEDLEDIDDLVDGMKDLKKASGEIVDGTKELYNGVDDFGDYLQAYVDTMALLKEGTAGIEQGAYLLSKNKKSLQEGADGLRDGLAVLNAKLSGGQVSGGDDGGETGGGTGGETGMEELEQLIASMEEQVAILKNSVSKEDSDGQTAIATLEGTIQTLKDSMKGGGLSALAGEEQLVAKLAQGSVALSSGIEQFNGGVDKLYEGAQKLNEATRQIKDAGKELTDGYKELQDGTKELRDGVKEFDKDGIAEITKQAGPELKDFANRIRALKQADDAYINYSGIAPGQTGMVRFIIETEEIKK